MLLHLIKLKLVGMFPALKGPLFPLLNKINGRIWPPPEPFGTGAPRIAAEKIEENDEEEKNDVATDWK